MIRISMGPISISTMGSDRWGQPEAYWSVNDWGFVSIEAFSNLLYYESKPNQMEEMLDKIDGVEGEKELLTAALKRRMDRLKSTSVVYQFNALKNPKTNDYIRMCAVLGSDDLVKLQFVPWFDAYVKQPIYSLICKIANKVLI